MALPSGFLPSPTVSLSFSAYRRFLQNAIPILASYQIYPLVDGRGFGARFLFRPMHFTSAAMLGEDADFRSDGVPQGENSGDSGDDEPPAFEA